MRQIILLFISLGLFAPTALIAQNENVQLAVWANEAIIATYTYDYQNFITEQKTIAKYFTGEGWTNYSTAFSASKIPDQVQKNTYFVSAVAQLPIQIKTIDSNHWEASAPVLVVYQNPQYMQKQTLQVTIQFTTASQGQGVRGLAISNLQSVVTETPCQCK